MTRSAQFITAVIVIVFLLVVIIIAMMRPDPTPEKVALLGTDATVPSETTDDNGQSTTTASITLADNASGTKMMVEEVNLPVSGYIALYRVNAENKVELIGESDILDGGQSTNVEIETTSALSLNQALIAVVYADDGDEMATANLPDRPLLANGMIVTDIDIIGQDRAKETDASLNSIQQKINAEMQ